MSAQNEFDEAVKDYEEAEKAGDRYIKALCKAMIQTIKTQDECACDPDEPSHPIRFAKTKVHIGEAIVGAAESLDAFAKAHRSGEKACTDPGPVTQGGGGGKLNRQLRDFYLADALRVDKQNHRMA